MKVENLIRAWNEGRVVLLPVPIGTKVWRVHRVFTPCPTSKRGWKRGYGYTEASYDLTNYGMANIYFTEQAAREAVERLENGT